MILDTNALSDIFKENEAIRAHIEKADQLYVPVIVLGEYLFGIKTSTKAHELSSLLSGFLNKVQELTIGTKTASHYADIRWELKKNGTP
ncbi:MAG: PIN domain-containing protein, partial [Spirochaetales bacterium]|nr:PIN domain-containing protein [Spirochaetales bacterium]